MKRYLASFAALLLMTQPLFSQKKQIAKTVNAKQEVARPKLVVGLVVDQMRWDYLYRYYSRYGEGGFKRLIDQGFSCDNTMISHLPSYTAVGHTTIFTGSVPAFHGIAGNDWTEQLTGKKMYCTSDSTVKGVGTTSSDGKMSPRNMLVSTITDELRLATNFKSKVIGVSLKDRASILPAGHTGQAFWYDDKNSSFITSTYYMEQLPSWVANFNSKKRAEALLSNGWNTLYPIETYTQSTRDNEIWEGKFSGEDAPVFPHDTKKLFETKKIGIRPTPFGNTLTLEFATEALKANQLGQGASTDFLAINCASTDYVGHQFGPNSIEIEDTYLRLDKDLATFFSLLDATVGKGEWLFFVSADHGAAHSIAFNQEHGIPADYWRSSFLADSLNRILGDKYNVPNLVRSISNYQVNYNLTKIDSAKLDYSAVKAASVNFLQRQPGILLAVDVPEIGKAPVPEPLKTMIINGYNFKRSGSVHIVLEAGWFEGSSKTGTTHGTWHPYDIHIPLVWYGWKIKPGKTNRETHMTDISATLAGLLQIQMPNGCVGKVIEEVGK
jgi:predicted AlkP superfamily pyrophosphatase or phosphodiesterase